MEAASEVGAELAAGGDLDGDGADDFLLAAHYGTGDVDDSGAVYVFRGR